MKDTPTSLTFESEAPQSIIDKIRKLKALSEGAAKVNSLAESEAAAVAINKLLTKYNLSLIDIEDNSADNASSAVTIERSDDISVKNTYGRLWKERLLTTLCRYNYCQPVAGSHKCFILGTALNIAAVTDLFNTLQSVYVYHAKNSYEEAKVNYRGGKLTEKYKRRYVTSYLLGCSIGLSVKLEEIQAKECKALVVFHKKHIDDYIAENLKIRSDKKLPVKKSNTNDTAYCKGFYRGLKTDLNKSIK